MRPLRPLLYVCCCLALIGCSSNTPESIVNKAIANRESINNVYCEFEVISGLVKNAADEEAGQLSQTTGKATGYYARKGDEEIVVIKENTIPQDAKHPHETEFIRVFMRTKQYEFRINGSGKSASVSRGHELPCIFDPWYVDAWQRSGWIDEAAKIILEKDKKAEPQVKVNGKEVEIELKTQGQLVFTFDPTKNYLPVAFGTVRGRKTGLRVLDATQNGTSWFPKVKVDVYPDEEYGDGKAAYRWVATKTEFREPTAQELTYKVAEPCEVRAGYSLPAGEAITPKSLSDIAAKAGPSR